MTECSHIGEDQLLSGGVDVVDVGAVDDQAFADADENVALAAELGGDHAFDLSELVGKNTTDVVGLHECRVVTVRGNIDDALGGNAD